jgi:L-proline amide hydrolase
MGNGQSTHLPLKDPSFWTTDLFIDELVNLLSHFRIGDDFYLLGHSWGGIFATEFIICRQPSGLKHLVLANSLTPSRPRNAAVARLRKQLPKNTQAIFREYEAAADTSSEKYKAALYKRFLCRLEPMPEPILFSFEQSQKNPSVLSAM